MRNEPMYLDIHVLQTVPPSCINRDDTGSPKTARFGGVRRARVSSQAWKKAVRDEFAHLLDAERIGCRTKDAVGLIAEYINEVAQGIENEESYVMAEAALKATGVSVKNKATGYLLFVSPRQAKALAQLAIEARENLDQIDKKRAKAAFNPKESPTLNAVDIALFGRMVADAPDLNVDASAQVAHAIGVGASEPEFDYFTAMDDRSPEDNAGAGMIGTVEYLSATLYRYATVDVYHLSENLGSARATEEAISSFIKAFVTSMPTGKQNTFANRTLPSAVVIQLRNTQPISLVNAFEKPVYTDSSRGLAVAACERLVQQETAIETAFGARPLETYVVCGDFNAIDVLSQLAEPSSLQDAIAGVESCVECYLQKCGVVDEIQE